MDNLTHTLVGATLAKAGLEKKFGKGTLLTLIIASNLPDIDAFWAMVRGGADAFLTRRMVTHSVPGIMVLSLLLAFVISRFNKNIKFSHLVFLALMGMVGHLFFDLVNSYGVVMLYPFSMKRFELSWIFIIDLVLWAIMLTPFIFKLILREKADLLKLCRVSGVSVIIYVGFCALGHYQGERLLNRIEREENISPQFSYVFPEALGCHRFRGVLRKNDTYTGYLLNVFQGQYKKMAEIKTDELSPVVAKARENPFAKKLEWFAKAPVWEVTASGSQVYDLRFMSFVLKSRRPHFVFQFDPEGNLKLDF
jgi:membrane-bound metal-dependent hydrolase YbcI (DUF457 family)